MTNWEMKTLKLPLGYWRIQQPGLQASAKAGAGKEHGKETWGSVKLKDRYAVARTRNGIGMVGSRRSVGSLAGECVDRIFV